MADLTTIVRQAIKGDKSAFSELVSRHRGLV